MFIKIEDLKVGDEILVSLFSNMIYGKVSRPVYYNKKKNKLSTRVWLKFDGEQKSWKAPWQGAKEQWFWIYGKDTTNLKAEKVFDLKERDIWLVKREESIYE